jgi:hypothetical protein
MSRGLDYEKAKRKAVPRPAPRPYQPKGPSGQQTKRIKHLRRAVGAPKGAMPSTARDATHEVAALQRQLDRGERWSASRAPSTAVADAARHRTLVEEIEAGVQRRLAELERQRGTSS